MTDSVMPVWMRGSGFYTAAANIVLFNEENLKIPEYKAVFSPSKDMTPRLWSTQEII